MVVELASLLIVFTAGFLAGQAVAVRTGNIWWGILAGALAFLVISHALIRLVSRQAAPPSPSPAEQELAWLEPRSFRSADLRDSRKWLLSMILLTLGAAVFFLWFTLRFVADAAVTRKLIVTAGGIVVFFLGMFGFTRLLRVGVRITDKAIVQELGDTPALYGYDTIDHCEIGNLLVGSRMHSVLVVVLKRGDRETFCIPSSISTDVLRAALERRGVRVATRADTLEDRFAS